MVHETVVQACVSTLAGAGKWPMGKREDMRSCSLRISQRFEQGGPDASGLVCWCVGVLVCWWDGGTMDMTPTPTGAPTPLLFVSHSSAPWHLDDEHGVAS